MCSCVSAHLGSSSAFTLLSSWDVFKWLEDPQSFKGKLFLGLRKRQNVSKHTLHNEKHPLCSPSPKPVHLSTFVFKKLVVLLVAMAIRPAFFFRSVWTDICVLKTLLETEFTFELSALLIQLLLKKREWKKCTEKNYEMICIKISLTWSQNRCVSSSNKANRVI